MGITYKDAGVDVHAGYEAVRLMKEHVASTMNDSVLSGLANFGGLYDLGNNKVLVAGADGVGTKLALAFVMDKHDTIGIDCVAMCVNDVVCHGAAPLFFLDYIATGKVYPERIAEVVKGVADGCVQAGCALLGGETAEMPGMYSQDEYDMAGFCVGMVNKGHIIDGRSVQEGDAIIGLASSGIHSNGFSLVRRLFKMESGALSRFVYELGTSLGEELLRPTRIYVKTILGLLEEYVIHGIAHITGGGFYENIPRIMPEGLRADIRLGSWEILPIFTMLEQEGQIKKNDMFHTFNMGIGMVCAIDKNDADTFVQSAQALGEKAYVIGEVVRGEAGITLCE
ncbi:MAG: phosphoribosylformylglycinamidine cyclo-ligase [Christensenellales bacterium]